MRARWSRDGLVLIALIVILELLGHPQVAGVAGLALIAGSVWFAVRSRRLAARLKAAWLKQWSEGRGIKVTAPPFRGRWKVSGCGPDAAKNHHLAAPDQWFAADFVRVDGETFGSEILSPVDGVVAYVEDGHPDKDLEKRPLRWWRKRNRRSAAGSPAGNYVAILLAGAEGSPVFLLLCHLRRGSLRVAVGAAVHAGEAVGLCGNSGNTTEPHLHIHAQDRAAVAVGVARGIPLRFGQTGDKEWIEPGTILES